MYNSCMALNMEKSTLHWAVEGTEWNTKGCTLVLGEVLCKTCTVGHNQWLWPMCSEQMVNDKQLTVTWHVDDLKTFPSWDQHHGWLHWANEEWIWQGGTTKQVTRQGTLPWHDYGLLKERTGYNNHDWLHLDDDQWLTRRHGWPCHDFSCQPPFQDKHFQPSATRPG